MSSQSYHNHQTNQSDFTNKKKKSFNNINNQNSPERNQAQPLTFIKLEDVLSKEKDSDRTIMQSALIEFCDKAKNAHQCPLGDKCLKAHSENNQLLRRTPFSPNLSQLKYIATMCLNPDSCQRKENCSFSHSQEEIKYHPTVFRTELCQRLKQCQEKSRCPNAHSPSEIRNVQNYHLIQQIGQQNNKGSTASNSLGESAGGSILGYNDKANFQGLSPSHSFNNFQGSQGNLQDLLTKKPQPPCTSQQFGIDLKKPGGDDVIAYLDLYNFKTQQCKIAHQHNPKKCFFYHEAKKDRRRQLGSYSSEICPYVINSATHFECPMGDSCCRSHNRVEEFYHPEKYKVKFCSSYPDKVESCDYGDMCAFAHSEAEVTVDQLDKFEKDVDFYMFHFKTVWCPYSDTSHARDACVYAHNWQDFRRKPHAFEYAKEQCQNWETKNFIQTYADGCKNEYRCICSHGWKEQEYHPLNYKMHACRQGEQCQKPHCPYFHSEQDRRQPVSQYFKISPKNRGTSVQQTQLYQPTFLNLLFTQSNRISQPYIDQSTGIQQQLVVSQQIYGCGPQSIPIIDPKIVRAYQESLFKNVQQHQQNPYQMVPQTEMMPNRTSKLPMSSSHPNYFNPQNSQQQYLFNQINNYQMQSHQNNQQSFARVQSQNAMLAQQMKKVPSSLSIQSNEFIRLQQQQQNQMMGQGMTMGEIGNPNGSQAFQPPPGLEDLSNQNRFQFSQSVPSFQHLMQQDLTGDQYNQRLRTDSNSYAALISQQQHQPPLLPQDISISNQQPHYGSPYNQPYTQQQQQQPSQPQHYNRSFNPQPSQFQKQQASSYTNLPQMHNQQQQYANQINMGYQQQQHQQQQQQLPMAQKSGSGIFYPSSQTNPPAQSHNIYSTQFNTASNQWSNLANNSTQNVQNQQQNANYPGFSGNKMSNHFQEGVLGSNPIDQGYTHQHRQSEDLDVDVNSPLDDSGFHDEEDDDDSFSKIKDLIYKRSNKKFSEEQKVNEVHAFLKENGLEKLVQVVDKLQIGSLDELKKYTKEEIKEILEEEREDNQNIGDLGDQLIQLLDNLQIK